MIDHKRLYVTHAYGVRPRESSFEHLSHAHLRSSGIVLNGNVPVEYNFSGKMANRVKLNKREMLMIL